MKSPDPAIIFDQNAAVFDGWHSCAGSVDLTPIQPALFELATFDGLEDAPAPVRATSLHPPCGPV